MDLKEITSRFKEEDLKNLLELAELLRGEKSATKKYYPLFEIQKITLKFVKANLSKKSEEGIELVLRYLTEYFTPDKNIFEISPLDAQDFITYLEAKAPKGYRVYFRYLKAIFNRLIKWEIIEKNPFEKIQLKKRQANEPAYLEIEELNKICKVLYEQKKYLIEDIVRFLFNTGMRGGEAIKLKWTDIDFKEKTITVGTEEFITKGRKQRFIPIEGEIYDILIRQLINKRNENDYVFIKRDRTPLLRDHLSKSFKKAARLAGLDEALHLHSLRHSCASNLIKNGANIYAVKELLGHSSLSLTERYSHIKLETLRAEMKKGLLKNK